MSRHSYGSPQSATSCASGGPAVLEDPAERWMRTCGAVGIHYRRRGGCTRRDGDLNPTWSTGLRSRRPGPALGHGRHRAPHREARSTWRRSSTPGPGVSWAGRSRITSAPSSSPTRCRWRPGDAGPRRPDRSPTPITGRSTRHGCSATGSVTPACSARWDPSATASTTPSPKRSSRACNASSSTNTTGRPATSSPNAIFEWIETWYNPRRRHSYNRRAQPHRLRDRNRGMITHTHPVRQTGGAPSRSCRGTTPAMPSSVRSTPETEGEADQKAIGEHVDGLMDDDICPHVNAGPKVFGAAVGLRRRSCRERGHRAGSSRSPAFRRPSARSRGRTFRRSARGGCRRARHGAASSSIWWTRK